MSEVESEENLPVELEENVKSMVYDTMIQILDSFRSLN